MNETTNEVVDERKAKRLVEELIAAGAAARLWWDRGPYCAQVFLTDDTSEFAPSILFHVEDADDYKLIHGATGEQFGWRWRGGLVGFEDTPLDEVSFEVLERNSFGDSEETVATVAISLRDLLRSGVTTTA